MQWATGLELHYIIAEVTSDFTHDESYWKAQK